MDGGLLYDAIGLAFEGAGIALSLYLAQVFSRNAKNKLDFVGRSTAAFLGAQIVFYGATLIVAIWNQWGWGTFALGLFALVAVPIKTLAALGIALKNWPRARRNGFSKLDFLILASVSGVSLVATRWVYQNVWYK